MSAVRYMLEKQRKLTAAIVGSLLLAGGLVAPASSEKYSAFSLAIGVLFGGLIAGHAYQGRASPAESGQPDPPPPSPRVLSAP